MFVFFFFAKKSESRKEDEVDLGRTEGEEGDFTLT